MIIVFCVSSIIVNKTSKKKVLNFTFQILIKLVHLIWKKSDFLP